MLNNFGQKTQSPPSSVNGSLKRQGLSLNLHTMPKTITGHLKKWLVLGLLILGIFALASLVFYTLTQ